jgi:UDP-N-acetylglucosamine--N-acetylmuramyl-(pentapeptide) pyrophosphoryl-undecaprenol N-acetylglucosamine transferase
MEFQEVQQRNLRHISVNFERGRTGFMQLPYAIWQSMRHIRTVRPDAVVTFGGYIGLPVALAAWICRVPVFVHEQTIATGRANQCIQLFAQGVFTSFPLEHEKRTKCTFTGNPLRRALFNIKSVNPPFPQPYIIVTGGGLGSHSLNKKVFARINDLCSLATIIHQTGNIAEYNDYDQALQLRSRLSPSLQLRYIPRKHILTEEWAQYLQHAGLLVGRTGANTFFEAIALQVPMVCVPLPWSVRDEQQKQAQILADAGVALICGQDESDSVFVDMIQNVLKNRSQYRSKYHTLGHLYVPDAADQLIQAIIRQTNTS